MQKIIDKKSGFTLIELMIVVLIISVLMAMAAYSYRGIRNRIRRTSCRENMRLIRQAYFLAQTEHPEIDNKNLTVPMLVKMGYLKKKPVCPSGGSYWITEEEENTRVSCVKTPDGQDHGYIE